MTNLATYGRNEASITAREMDTPLANFDDGMNFGASNAPGIGICTDVVNPKLSDWTVLDQAEAARQPQDSQHLGGDGLGDGDATNAPIQVIQGADINDTAYFMEALAQAAPGVGIGVANAAPINRSSQTVEIGDRVWATFTVA